MFTRFPESIGPFRWPAEDSPTRHTGQVGVARSASPPFMDRGGGHHWASFGSGLRPGVFRAPGLGWSGPYPAPHFTGREEAQPPDRPDIVDRRPAGPWDDWSAGVPPKPWTDGSRP